LKIERAAGREALEPEHDVYKPERLHNIEGTMLLRDDALT
jgi:hypothetical protein